MHALSKKYYYDVIKGTQEDTIIEYDSNDEKYDRGTTGAKSTSDVGCFIRCHTKTYAIQTQWSRNNKNFRNEYTNTSDLASSESTLPNSDTSRYIAIHRSLSCEDIAISRARSVQTTGPINPKNQNTVRGKNDVYVEAVTGVQIHKKGFYENARNNPSKYTVTDALWLMSDEGIQHKNSALEVAHQTEGTCYCHEIVNLPCQQCLTACRTFTLGTTETRRIQNENCRSKLIGGCRVPVCKGYKRF